LLMRCSGIVVPVGPLRKAADTATRPDLTPDARGQW
jgi:hypothetical protein